MKKYLLGKMRSVVFLLPVLVLLAVTKVTSQSGGSKGNIPDKDLNGETAYLNFMKVLACVLITTPEPPKVVVDSVKVVMRELMNGNASQQGYFSYLSTTLLRVFDSPLQTQVDVVFGVILTMNDEHTPIHKASNNIQEFLSSRYSKAVFADIENYVKNLFQPAVVIPETFGSPYITDSLARPANGRRPSWRNSREHKY